VTVLAIETATDIASAALLDGDALIGSLAFLARRDVCQRLLPEVEAMMTRAGLSPQSLSAIAVGRGPGSFTGIRIGVAIAKGLALAVDAPVFGISTLAACAYPALGRGGIACALIPAHGDEFYAGLFRAGAELEPLGEGIQTGAALMAHLSQLGDRVIFAAVAPQVRDLLPLKELEIESAFLPHELTWDLACWVGRLAQARLRAGDPGDGIGLAPVYLRPSQAEMQADPLT
jgi:tRNA threonylcarbamoyladenosine biosynthesis protein TsaB